MFPKSFKKLIDHFASLPSIGPKMAERLVLYLFKQDKETLLDFSTSLAEFKASLRSCKKCFNISESDVCEICRNTSRDQKKICVVEDPLDVIAIEKTKKYFGLYFVLGGTFETIKKDTNDQLKLDKLKSKVEEEKITEVILATNPTTEGDTTALYISRMLKPTGITVTRLARGLSTGGDIEYADELTLGSAILNRK